MVLSGRDRTSGGDMESVFSLTLTAIVAAMIVGVVCHFVPADTAAGYALGVAFLSISLLGLVVIVSLFAMGEGK